MVLESKYKYGKIILNLYKGECAHETKIEKGVIKRDPLFNEVIVAVADTAEELINILNK